MSGSQVAPLRSHRPSEDVSGLVVLQVGKEREKKPSDWGAGLAVSAANCPDDCFYVTSLRLPLAAALVLIDSLSLLNFFPPRSRGAKKSLAGLCGGGLSGR